MTDRNIEKNAEFAKRYGNLPKVPLEGRLSSKNPNEQSIPHPLPHPDWTSIDEEDSTRLNASYAPPNFQAPEHELGRIGWATVPICSICWHKLYKKIPIRMRNPPVEICYQCLIPTQAGIYTRGYAKVVQVMLKGLGLTAVYEKYPN